MTGLIKSSLYTRVLGLALAVLLLCGIGLVFSFLQNSLLNERADIHRAKIALVNAVRFEKTFVMQRDTAAASSAYHELHKALALIQQQNETPAITSLQQQLKKHEQVFTELEAALIERGLNEELGREGALRTSVHAIEKIVEDARMERLEITMLSIRRGEKDFFLRGQDKYIERVQKLADKLISQITASPLPNGTKQEMIALATSYRTDFEAATQAYHKVAELADELMANTNVTLQELEQIIGDIEQQADSRELLTIIAIFLSMGLGLGLAFWMASALSNPVKQLHHAAQAVAAGNTDITVQVRSNDEIGQLATAFNAMVAQLNSAEEEKQKYLETQVHDLLQNMDGFANGDLTIRIATTTDNPTIAALYKGFNTVVDTMRSTLQQVIETIQVSAAAAEQISAATDQLAASAHKQSAQAATIAAAVEEMASTSVANSSTSKQAATLAKQYQNTAYEGETVIQETVAKIRIIADVVQQSVKTINKLSDSSTTIGEIVSVINDIADQTNLLALNAAIEAARAGEQGRGFAVVADEVRKLAERTGKATKEIASMIQSIQTESHAAVGAMQRGESEVSEGIVLADKAGGSLSGMMAISTETLQIIEQIAVASEEQSATTNDMAVNIDSMATMSESATADISGIARSVNQLNQQMHGLRQLVNRFSLQASR